MSSIGPDVTLVTSESWWLPLRVGDTKENTIEVLFKPSGDWYEGPATASVNNENTYGHVRLRLKDGKLIVDKSPNGKDLTRAPNALTS